MSDSDDASLDERISRAFLHGVTSTALAELIRESEAASLKSAEAAEQSRARALDPAISIAEVAKARRVSEDSAFRRDRLQEALRRLEERLREVRELEEQSRRRIQYDEVLSRRDALVQELRREYPAITARLADLIARVDANDQEVERVNTRALPSGVPHIACAELVARGLSGFTDGTANVPSITKQLRLPSFTYSAFDRFLWPREEA